MGQSGTNTVGPGPQPAQPSANGTARYHTQLSLSHLVLHLHTPAMSNEWRADTRRSAKRPSASLSLFCLASFVSFVLVPVVRSLSDR
jgi:hypothetical protein